MQTCAELLVLRLGRGWSLFARRSLEESLDGPHGARWLSGQCRRGFSRGWQEFAIRHDPRDQPEIGGPPRIKRLAEQDQFGGGVIPDLQWHHEARRELGHEAQVDERHLEPRALAGVHEVTMRKNCGTNTDCGS